MEDEGFFKTSARKMTTSGNCAERRNLNEFKPRIIYYELPGGWTLLVGATDADNDYLEHELAEPADWWFHADNVPGSHVILRAKPDAEPSRETLSQAAAVAAYHSKARNAGMMPVHCTRARYVRNRAASKPARSTWRTAAF